MSRNYRNPLGRLLDEAEGYLMLEMPARALEILDRRVDWGSMQFEAYLLKGQSLRSLNQFREALWWLEQAATLRPTDPGVAMALGWCYKRTNRLAQAIDAIERSRRSFPNDPFLRYNLACYWSLAGNPTKALEELAKAIELEPEIRKLVQKEADFASLRHNPIFEQVLGTKSTC